MLTNQENKEHEFKLLKIDKNGEIISSTPLASTIFRAISAEGDKIATKAGDTIEYMSVWGKYHKLIEELNGVMTLTPVKYTDGNISETIRHFIDYLSNENNREELEKVSAVLQELVNLSYKIKSLNDGLSSIEDDETGVQLDNELKNSTLNQLSSVEFDKLSAFESTIQEKIIANPQTDLNYVVLHTGEAELTVDEIKKELIKKSVNELKEGAEKVKKSLEGKDEEIAKIMKERAEKMLTYVDRIGQALENASPEKLEVFNDVLINEHSTLEVLESYKTQGAEDITNILEAESQKFKAMLPEEIKKSSTIQDFELDSARNFRHLKLANLKMSLDNIQKIIEDIESLNINSDDKINLKKSIVGTDNKTVKKRLKNAFNLKIPRVGLFEDLNKKITSINKNYVDRGSCNSVSKEKIIEDLREAASELTSKGNLIDNLKKKLYDKDAVPLVFNQENLRENFKKLGFLVTPKSSQIAGIFPEKEWVTPFEGEDIAKMLKEKSKELINHYKLHRGEGGLLQYSTSVSSIKTTCITWQKKDNKYIPVLGLSGGQDERKAKALIDVDLRLDMVRQNLPTVKEAERGTNIESLDQRLKENRDIRTKYKLPMPLNSAENAYTLFSRKLDLELWTEFDCAEAATRELISSFYPDSEPHLMIAFDSEIKKGALEIKEACNRCFCVHAIHTITTNKDGTLQDPLINSDLESIKRFEVTGQEETKDAVNMISVTLGYKYCMKTNPGMNAAAFSNTLDEPRKHAGVFSQTGPQEKSKENTASIKKAM